MLHSPALGALALVGRTVVLGPRGHGREQQEQAEDGVHEAASRVGSDAIEEVAQVLLGDVGLGAGESHEDGLEGEGALQRGRARGWRAGTCPCSRARNCWQPSPSTRWLVSSTLHWSSSAGTWRPRPTWPGGGGGEAEVARLARRHPALLLGDALGQRLHRLVRPGDVAGEGLAGEAAHHQAVGAGLEQPVEGAAALQARHREHRGVPGEAADARVAAEVDDGIGGHA